METMYKVGTEVFVKTENLFYLGIINFVSDDELILSESGVVFDTGPLSHMFKTGEVREYGHMGTRCSIPRDSIIEVTEWPHPLPREMK